MKAELITIGDEILIGQIVNTNAVFLAKALNKIGIEVTQITSISDESTAIVVKGDTFKVIGRSYVIMYDGTFWSREGSRLKKLPPKDQLFYYLKKGDRYNLKERKVIR